MEVRKICQWCGKPFIAQKTTTCYCSHQCSNLGYKERIRERKRQLKRSQELLQPRQAAEGQDFFSFAQAAKLIGVTRQYIYKLVKESKLRASRISGKKPNLTSVACPKRTSTSLSIAQPKRLQKNTKSTLNGCGLTQGNIKCRK